MRAGGEPHEQSPRPLSVRSVVSHVLSPHPPPPTTATPARRSVRRLREALSALCTALVDSPATSNPAVVDVQVAVTNLYKIFDASRRRQAEAELVAGAEEAVRRKRALLQRVLAATQLADTLKTM